MTAKLKGKAMKDMKAVKDMTENLAATGAEFTHKTYDRMVGTATEQAEKAAGTAFKAFEDAAKFSQENLNAYLAASAIVAKGAENAGKAWMAFSQEAFAAYTERARSLLGVKTLREVVDLNSEATKATFEKFVAESTRLLEMTVKVANQAAEPINARLNVAVEKLFKPIAV
ncbi:MAG: phasin family protein [Pseudomonadota bacterium]